MTGETIDVDPSFIDVPTTEYRKGNNIYENYVSLFKKMNIEPMDILSRNTRYINFIASINVRSIMTASDRGNYSSNRLSATKSKEYKETIDKKIDNAREVLFG